MSTYPYKRSERLNDLLRKTLATMMLQEIKDPRLQGLTITRVEITDDLQLARVYFRFLQHADQPDSRFMNEVHTGLEKASGYLRRALGKMLYLKKIPQLRFLYDASIEQQQQVENALRKIAEERGSEGDAA